MPPPKRRFRFVASLVVVTAACSSPTATGSRVSTATSTIAPASTATVLASWPTSETTATTPSIVSTPNSTPAPSVYEHASASQLSPAVAQARSYVYVPSNDDGSVTVLDQATMQIVDTYH